MFKKIALASAAAASLIAVPTAADAQSYYGHNRGSYSNGYYGRSYNNGYYGRSYNNGYSGRGYSNGYYGRGYSNSYYGNGYGNNYRGYYGRRCSGTTGTIVGGVAGALL